MSRYPLLQISFLSHAYLFVSSAARLSRRKIPGLDLQTVDVENQERRCRDSSSEQLPFGKISFDALPVAPKVPRRGTLGILSIYAWQQSCLKISTHLKPYNFVLMLVEYSTYRGDEETDRRYKKQGNVDELDGNIL